MLCSIFTHELTPLVCPPPPLRGQFFVRLGGYLYLRPTLALGAKTVDKSEEGFQSSCPYSPDFFRVRTRIFKINSGALLAYHISRLQYSVCKGHPLCLPEPSLQSCRVQGNIATLAPRRGHRQRSAKLCPDPRSCQISCCLCRRSRSAHICSRSRCLQSPDCSRRLLFIQCQRGSGYLEGWMHCLVAAPDKLYALGRILWSRASLAALLSLVCSITF